ncbi:MAG: zinc ribbon domain-containing protein [Fidelibacterota bacterium]
MRKLISLYFLILGLVGATNFKDITLIIYPEYYSSSVMVELSGSVDPIDLPVELGLAVPANTDSIFFVNGDRGDETNFQVYSAVEEDGENWVYFPIKRPFFRAVLFYSPFDSAGPRAIDYAFKTNQDLRNIYILVQRPEEAKNFVWSETDLGSGEDEHGVLFYQKHLHELTAGETKVISFTYENPSGLTTMASLARRMGNTQTAVKQGPLRHRLPLWQPLVVLGGLALVIGVLFYRSQQAKLTKPTDAVCKSCGEKLVPGAKFCSGCGVPV